MHPVAERNLVRPRILYIARYPKLSRMLPCIPERWSGVSILPPAMQELRVIDRDIDDTSQNFSGSCPHRYVELLPKRLDHSLQSQNVNYRIGVSVYGMERPAKCW